VFVAGFAFVGAAIAIVTQRQIWPTTASKGVTPVVDRLCRRAKRSAAADLSGV